MSYEEEKEIAYTCEILMDLWKRLGENCCVNIEFKLVQAKLQRRVYQVNTAGMHTMYKSIINPHYKADLDIFNFVNLKLPIIYMQYFYIIIHSSVFA